MCNSFKRLLQSSEGFVYMKSYFKVPATYSIFFLLLPTLLKNLLSYVTYNITYAFYSVANVYTYVNTKYYTRVHEIYFFNHE